MPRIRLRLELPPGVDVSDDDVRAAVLHAIQGRRADEHGDDLCKAEGHAHAAVDTARKLPHRYPQSLVAQSVALYRERMQRMIDEVADVLSG